MGSFLPAPRMRGVIDLHKVIHVDVRIPLSRGKILVAEHFLDGPEIGSRVEQVGCEAVPEPVGTELLPKSASDEFGFQDAIH